MKMRAILFAALLAVPAARASALPGPGPLDTHFGNGGVRTTATAPGSGFDVQNGIAIQQDGKILVGGESDMGDAGGYEWRITRYTKNGDLDTRFGSGGTVLTNMSNVGEFDERIVALALQKDGKIVAAGWVENPAGVQNSALARYNSNGTLDTSFGNGGKVITDVAAEPDLDFINQVAIDSQGRIVVAGGCRSAFVGRFLPNGTLDPSFNAAGPRPGLQLAELARTGEDYSEILGMTLDASGRIVAAGYSRVFDGIAFHVDSAVARFRTDGTLDPTFNPNGPRPGVVITPVSPDYDVNVRVAIDNLGRIVAAGDAFVGVGSGFFDITVSRYLSNGTLDASFGNGGVVVTNVGPGDSDDDAEGLEIENDGKILVGGSTGNFFLFDSDFMVARFLSNGSLDGSFGQGGIAITPTAPGSASDEIFAMDFQGGSKLVAVGQCTQPATGQDVCLVRYKLGGAGAAGGDDDDDPGQDEQ